MVHYIDTIQNKVSQELILKYLDFNLKNRLKDVFGNKNIAVWGSRGSSANRSRFEKMQPGDDILIVEGETIKLLGKVAAKTINPDLSRELWKNLKGESSEGWDLIYFIANPVEIELPFGKLKDIFNYKENWSLRGFTNIANNKLEDFYNKYDDLYSILLRLKQGELIEKIDTSERIVYETQKEVITDVNEIMNERELSEHTKIQWKLVQLGLKTGAKAWIPRNDQARITKKFNFKEFEEEFTAGIDTPARYVENIDVVWKEEFRIDAAFEIENSTAIYSGLLRFSDLKVIAPNSNYPLFIVAPLARKNRVFDQIKRPTFKKMSFDKKVKYLSYESIGEIDKFAMNMKSGLDVKIFEGRAEAIN